MCQSNTPQAYEAVAEVSMTSVRPKTTNKPHTCGAAGVNTQQTAGTQTKKQTDIGWPWHPYSTVRRTSSDADCTLERSALTSSTTSAVFTNCATLDQIRSEQAREVSARMPAPRKPSRSSAERSAQSVGHSISKSLNQTVNPVTN